MMMIQSQVGTVILSLGACRFYGAPTGTAKGTAPAVRRHRRLREAGNIGAWTRSQFFKR
jgi:hypothetical protein